MKSAQIREAYLSFFEARGHARVPSSPVVPVNDPTLLFTNSGMVQFKDALTGKERRAYTRATSVQRCIRAGGKHNDLENVGYTARHHTFFEMLGNFSFGDYFKEETIAWAWEFVTGVLGVDPARLWITVHHDDSAAWDLWTRRIGFPAARMTRLGDASNFWSMGDTGPCGHNSELFFDHGHGVPGGPPGSPDEDGDRFVEVWNLVFPEYDLQADGTRLPLASKGVDTGMGLERIAAALQGVHSNYEIDLFASLVRATAAAVGVSDEEEIRRNPSLRVIADHIRSCAYLIADGVVPGNEDRAYVLRRIMRRALRHGHKLGATEPFFHRLVAPLVEAMAGAYPELDRAAGRVTAVIRQEEERFADTLRQGMVELERAFARVSEGVLPGDVAFRLYDTYGFPVDMTADVARERGARVDLDAYEREMEAQRNRARAASRFAATDVLAGMQDAGATPFIGYEVLACETSVASVYRQQDGRLQPVPRLGAGEAGVVVLRQTPFYAESGGQLADAGSIASDSGARFVVTDVQRRGDGQVAHVGTLAAGALAAGAHVVASVDAVRRRSTALNHSATHLVHAALRRVLGEHVEQRGSQVSAERLRFDFSNQGPLSTAELREIAAMVNDQVLANSEVRTEVLAFDEAIARGAMALFGEKYGERVRVLTMGDGFSVELCGGTHVRRTGDIGLVSIVAESGVAAGVRRIEAVTGHNACARVAMLEQSLSEIGERLRATPGELLRRVDALLEDQRAQRREIERLQTALAEREGGDLLARARDVGGVRVLAERVEVADAQALLSTMDALKAKLGSGVIVLATVQDGRVNLAASVSRDLVDRLDAGALVRDVGQQVGARGGGRRDSARAGGGERVDALPVALAAVAGWVGSRIGA
jgi:alanyl-tRNA synthetase